MALRGKAPQATDKRLKMLLFGPAGSGKTTASIQFPKPYLIDTERGAENEQYVELLNKTGGAYLFTTDPKEVIEEVRSLISEKHEYRTLIIDPLTTIYNNMVDAEAERIGTDFGRHKIGPDRVMRQLAQLLLRLDMNVIITSHAKTKWDRAKDAKGKDTIVDAGNTFDCYGKLDYLMDLAIEVGRRGKERVGTVRKSRVLGLAEGEVFPFSYDEIAERYGRSILERASVAVKLATPDEIAEIKRLVGVLNLPSETVSKWLDKADATEWEEMPSETINKCIDWCKKQVERN